LAGCAKVSISRPLPLVANRLRHSYGGQGAAGLSEITGQDNGIDRIRDSSLKGQRSAALASASSGTEGRDTKISQLIFSSEPSIPSFERPQGESLISEGRGQKADDSRNQRSVPEAG